MIQVTVTIDERCDAKAPDGGTGPRIMIGVEVACGRRGTEGAATMAENVMASQLIEKVSAVQRGLKQFAQIVNQAERPALFVPGDAGKLMVPK